MIRVALTLLAAAGVQGDPLACQSECVHHGREITTCHAGQPAEEAAVIEHLADGGLPFGDLALEFVEACTETCERETGNNPELFSVAIETSSAVPLACRYDWTWCVGEACRPERPEVDNDLFYELSLCDHPRPQPFCLHQIQAGPLAGCGYFQFVGDAPHEWRGFQCRDGLVEGYGLQTHRWESGSTTESSGTLQRGYRVGTWRTVLTSKEGLPSIRQDTDYAVFAHGQLTASDESGIIGTVRYRFGEKVED